MQKKNQFLQPIYRDLKSTIKHMTNTDEYKLMKDYVKNRNLILNSIPAESKKALDGLNQLKNEYAKFIKNQRLRIKSDPSLRLKVMQKRVEDLFQLLNTWQQYVDIIYAHETEINMYRHLKDQGLYGSILDGETVTEDMAFAQKVQQENTQKKLAELLRKDDQLDEQKVGEDNDEPYLSVEEGVTTDTAVTTDMEGYQEEQQMADKQDSPQPVADDVGIQSSDEESAAVADVGQ